MCQCVFTLLEDYHNCWNTSPFFLTIASMETPDRNSENCSLIKWKDTNQGIQSLYYAKWRNTLTTSNPCCDLLVGSELRNTCACRQEQRRTHMINDLLRLIKNFSHRAQTHIHLWLNSLDNVTYFFIPNFSWRVLSGHHEHKERNMYTDPLPWSSL